MNEHINNTPSPKFAENITEIRHTLWGIKNEGGLVKKVSNIETDIVEIRMEVRKIEMTLKMWTARLTGAVLSIELISRLLDYYIKTK